MKLTKRELKRIIKEEYTQLKRRGLIREYTELGPGIPGDDGKVLRIAGGMGDSFAITNAGDYFYTSVYDDNFPQLFIDKLEQARAQGFDEVQLSYQMNTEHLSIDEMIQRAEDIDDEMQVREGKNRFISEMKASYGTTPMLAFSSEPSRPFSEIRAEALDIMDELMDGGAFLMNPRDYGDLDELIQDLAADGDEDFETFRRLLAAHNHGQYIRISFR